MTRQASDIAVLLAALKEVHLLLGGYLELTPRDSEKTINRILEAVDRPAIYNAMQRLEQAQ